MKREMKNEVTVTGVVVKCDIKEFETKAGKDAIGGTIVLRSEDGSENEFRVFSNKWKNDSDGNETNETRYFFNQYEEFASKVVSLEDDAENASVVTITKGTIDSNDFKGNDGNIVSSNKLSAKFLTILSDKDIALTQQTAKFEVEGIIEKIEDESGKDQLPTGKGKIKLNYISSTIDFKDKNKKPESREMYPITLTIPSDLYDAFKGAGYYEGCLAKFIGNLKNTTKVETVTEKQSFGEDVVKQITTHIKEYEVRSGNTASTYDVIELTQDEINMLMSKRKQHLEEIKTGNVQDGSFGEATKQPQQKPISNPFAGANPFA